MRPEPLTDEELIKVLRLVAEGLDRREYKRLFHKLKALNEFAKPKAP
jgi:hypothetical protein